MVNHSRLVPRYGAFSGTALIPHVCAIAKPQATTFASAREFSASPTVIWGISFVPKRPPTKDTLCYNQREGENSAGRSVTSSPRTNSGRSSGLARSPRGGVAGNGQSLFQRLAEWDQSNPPADGTRQATNANPRRQVDWFRVFGWTLILAFVWGFWVSFAALVVLAGRL